MRSSTWPTICPGFWRRLAAARPSSKPFRAENPCEVPAFGTLDGRQLVAFQCVVPRSDWEEVRERFYDAFRIQKVAYRHANGGKSAPTLVEDATPRFVSKEQEVVEASASDELVVRKTFYELRVEPEPALRRSSSWSGVIR